MSRHIHIDPLGGLAGDMFAAAMLDAFPDLEAPLMADLEAAGILANVRVGLEKVVVNTIAASGFTVTPTDKASRTLHHYRDIRAFLRKSNLNDEVCDRALAIFDCLAEAEAEIHGVTPDDVHFHEVADWDSIADIVAAASLMIHSKAETWTCGTIPMGGGTVRTEHGIMPVPAPATARLLRDFSLRDDGETGERVTPTGAAILRHLMDDNRGAKPSGVLTGTGAGGGTKRFQTLANIVRLMVLDTSVSEVHQPQQDRIAILTFEVDDMNPEELAIAMDHLGKGAGVVDAGYQLRQGKKGRPQFSIQVLADPASVDAVADLCFRETSTLGLRVDVSTRRILRREATEVETGGKKLRAKQAYRPDGTITAKVEADDLAGVSGHRLRKILANALGSKNE